MKSAERIGSTLRAIQAVQQTPTPGSAVSGLDEADRLVLESFADVDSARLAQRSLAQAGVMCSVRNRRRRVELLVDYGDRRKAVQVLELHRRNHPDAGRRRLGSHHDFLILGGIVGVSIGLVLLVSNFRGLLVLVVPATLGVAGSLLGHLADRIRLQFQRRGRFGLGVWEFLILATLPALAVFLWNFVVKVVYSS